MRASYIGAFAAAAAAPLLVASGGTAINTMILAAAYSAMALGLNVIVGFAGLLDLGYVAFYAIGSYTAAYLRSGYWPPGIHLDLFEVLAIAAGTALLAGVIIGTPTLRLRKDYVALVTLAFGEIVGAVALNGRSVHLFGGTLTYGPNGIGPIDRIDLPVLGRFSDFDLRPWFWFALALVALTLTINIRLRDSRIGRAWLAVREDEVVAATSGIPVVRVKLAAYGIGAAMGGAVGVFLASYEGSVNPAQFHFQFSIFILTMVVIGGAGSVGGVVIGAVALTIASTAVISRLPVLFSLDTDLSAGAYGFLLVIATLGRYAGPGAGLAPSSSDGIGMRPPLRRSSAAPEGDHRERAIGRRWLGG